MKIAIYRGGSKVFDIPVDSGSLSHKVNGEHVVKVAFKSPAVVALAIGDYCTIQGKRYTLNYVPNINKISSTQYAYDITLEGRQYELLKVKYTNAIVGTFSLTGNLAFFVDNIIANMNRLQSGWSKSTVKSGTETKTLTFANENCLTVLQRLCDEYKVEFRISESKAISVDNFTSASICTFEYGKSKGLYELTRQALDSKNIITRLVPLGSERNLPANYRSYATRLMIGNAPTANYIEQNVSTYDIIEEVKNFDEIYPRFTGAISSVTDFKTFICSAINFDMNTQMLPGITPKISFRTGALSGMEFEIVSYTHATKTIVLKVNDQEKTINNSGTPVKYTIPNATILPAINDSFVLLDLLMPDTYIAAAETELLAAGQAYLSANCNPRVAYKADKIDPLFVRSNALSFEPGNFVTVVDLALSINKLTRITALTLDLLVDGKYTLELGDDIVKQAIYRVTAEINELQRIVQTAKLNDVVSNRRNWRSTEELVSMVFDQDGYFDGSNIKPNSVSTQMLAVGSKAGDFVLNGVVIEPMYTADKSKVNASSGSLVHFSINETVTIWSITGALTTGLVDGSAYYIYAKCNRSTSAASIVFDTVQRKVDSDATWYCFVIGVLHSVVDGVRGISNTYGQTTINGKYITTGRISGNNNYIDLDTGDIVGKVTFRGGSNGYNNIADKPDLSGLATIASLSSVQSSLQSQIDGNISSYFYDGVPTLANLPASSWTTDPVRAIHLGDLYYDNTTKYCYRFQYANSVYSWERISDTDITKALNDIATLGTKKRQIFSIQPDYASDYAVGDLWLNATVGSFTNETLKCITAKATNTAFNAAHWALAQKYTDDTTVNALQIGGKNLIPNSKIDETSNAYGFAYRSCQLEAGKTYTLSANGRCNGVESGHFLHVIIYRPDWSWSDGIVINDPVNNTQSVQIIAPISGTYSIGSYYYPSGGSRTGNITVNWYKLELGNKATDWTPALEDVDASINTAWTLADDAYSLANDANTEAVSASLLASDVFNNVNNLKFGVKNLIPYSLVGYTGYWWSVIRTNGLLDPFGEYKAISLLSSNNSAYFRSIFSVGNLDDTKDYVFGAWLKADAACSVEFGQPYNGSYINAAVTTSWKFYQVTLEAKVRTHKSFAGIDGIPNGRTLYIAQTTLAEGNRLTSTILATEDVTKVTDNFTSIDGGILTGNIVQVGSEASGVCAGITGSEAGADKVRFFAGSTHANRNSAPFRVLQDGSAQLNKVEISLANSLFKFKINPSTGHLEVLSGNGATKLIDIFGDEFGESLSGQDYLANRGTVVASYYDQYGNIMNTSKLSGNALYLIDNLVTMIAATGLFRNGQDIIRWEQDVVQVCKNVELKGTIKTGSNSQYTGKSQYIEFVDVNYNTHQLTFVNGLLTNYENP